MRMPGHLCCLQHVAARCYCAPSTRKGQSLECKDYIWAQPWANLGVKPSICAKADAELTQPRSLSFGSCHLMRLSLLTLIFVVSPAWHRLCHFSGHVLPDKARLHFRSVLRQSLTGFFPCIDLRAAS